MSGGAARSDGQHCSCLQSAIAGHSALKENVAVFNCESTPASGSEFVGLVTRVNVYGEKSPVPLSSTVIVSGSSLVAGATLWTCKTAPPVKEMFAGASVSPRASLMKVSANCSPDPGGPTTSR